LTHLTCFVSRDGRSCTFFNQVLKSGDIATIESIHVNTNDNQITRVEFVGSSIFSLPSQLFVKFPNLSDLRMNASNLHRIEPNTFRYARWLHSVNLNDNFIRNIEWNAFNGAHGLTSLWLKQNQLTEINRNSFEGLENLVELWILNNPITRIHQDAFTNLINLQTIYASNTRLTFLHRNLFRNNLRLELIGMDGNEISVLLNDMFSHLRHLDILTIWGCVDRLYLNANTRFPEIERDLANCSQTYAEQEPIQEANDNLHDKFDHVHERIDRFTNLLMDLSSTLKIQRIQ
jgi:hypothetical protein